MKPWLKRIRFVLGGLLLAQALVRVYLYLRPKITPPSLKFLLDSRIREWYRDPPTTLAPLGLRPGQIVLEVGGGTGFFTIAAAQQIGPNGLLLSIELQRGMLSALQRRVRFANLRTISVEQADAMALPFADESIDAALMIAVLPMVPRKQQVLRELRRVLKPGARLLISEEVIAPEYVPPLITRRWARRAEFEIVTQDPGFWSYSVLCRKPYVAG